MLTIEDDGVSIKLGTDEVVLSDKEKLKSIREYCNKYQDDKDKFVNFDWILSHIMCIVKYGEGFEMSDLK